MGVKGRVRGSADAKGPEVTIEVDLEEVIEVGVNVELKRYMEVLEVVVEQEVELNVEREQEVERA